MKSAFSLFTLAFVCTLAACSPTPSDVRITVTGPVQGTLNDDVASFRGIPYAAAPVRELRWQAPQPATPWQETLDASAPGPACWQDASGGNSAFLAKLTEGAGMGGFTQWMLTNFASLATPEVSEDCLTLNIVTPQTQADGATTDELLPVMFWIHGGGHQFGSGAGPYESPTLAKKGVVLVSINYRLGLYGFLAHPDLTAEDPNHSSGNYGMLDQIAALKWVAQNIEAFGGDPNNVTIFGESAGGHSVGQLMASPLSQNLFHRAIAQSGTGFYQFQATDAAHERISGFDAGRMLATKAGVSGANELASLRAMSTDALAPFAADPDINSTLHPQIDGYVLPTSTSHIFAAGQQAPIPLIVGSNADEGSVLYYMGLSPVDGGTNTQPENIEQWEQLLADQFADQASAVARHYAVDTDTQVVKASEQLMGDSWFGRHAFYMAQKHSAAGHPTYLYFYERHPPNANQTIGASHALELNHVFGGFIPFWPSDDRDDELSNEMQSFWSQFAKTGNPNSTATAADKTWATFSDLAPQEMAFGHDRSGSRPVARADRYRAMQAQLDRRMAAVIPATAPPNPNAEVP